MAAFLAANRPEMAVEEASRALATDPHDAQLWCLLAQATLATGEPGAALNHVDRAIALDPTAEWPHRLAAVALLQRGATGDAVRASRESARLSGGAVESLEMLTYALSDHLEARRSSIYMGRARQAEVGAIKKELLSLSSTLVTRAPDWPNAHVAQGQAMRAVGKSRAAAKAYRRALELDPTNAGALNDLGAARLDLGRTHSGAEALLGSLRADPHGSVARQNIAVMFVQVWITVAALGIVLGLVVLTPLVDTTPQDGDPGYGRYAAAGIAIVLALGVWWHVRRLPTPIRDEFLRMARRVRPGLAMWVSVAAVGLTLFVMAV